MLERLSNDLFSHPEWLHPAIVHFPIVLICLAGFSKITCLANFKSLQSHSPHLDFFYRVNLYSSVPFLILSLYLGDLAAEAAKLTTTQNLIAIQSHEDLAYRLLVCFFLLFALEGFSAWKQKFSKWFQIFSCIVWIIVFYFLIATGHSGAELVYKFRIGPIS